MVLLITRADIATYRQISDTVYDDVLNMHINDAQFVDVQKLMGTDFYNDMIRNSTDANYVTLLDGGDYTYQDVTYTNQGLKAVIVFYTDARYKLLGSNIDTPFSFVTKTSEDSIPVSYSERKTVSKASEQTAYMYWENVRDFLDRNSDDYPLWKNGCGQAKTGNFRISKIG